MEASETPSARIFSTDATPASLASTFAGAAMGAAKCCRTAEADGEVMKNKLKGSEKKVDTFETSNKGGKKTEAQSERGMSTTTGDCIQHVK
jgi:hypothetical protein